MRHSVGVGKLAALLSGALCAGLAMAAPPDFTGVWTNPGRPAIGGARAPGAPAPLPPMRARCQGARRCLPEAGGQERRFAGRLLPWHRHAGLDAGLGWLPDGDHPASGPDHRHIRGPRRNAALLLRCAQCDRGRSRSRPQWIFVGALGRRDAGSRDRQSGRPGGPAHHVALRCCEPSLSATTSTARTSRDGAFWCRDDHDRPAFYTAPVRIEKRWAEVPNGRLLPYECDEEVWTRSRRGTGEEGRCSSSLKRCTSRRSNSMNSRFTLAVLTAAMLAAASIAPATRSSLGRAVRLHQLGCLHGRGEGVRRDQSAHAR